MKKADLLINLSVAFNRELSTGPVLSMMIKALSDVTDEELENAALLAIKRCKFMPSIAELRELVQNYRDKYKTSKEYRDKIKQVCDWLYSVHNWDFYSEDSLIQEQVDEALIALDMEPGSVDVRDI